jgi:hypothetical protein
LKYDNAYYATEISHLSAFLRIAGDVRFAFRRTVAGKTRLAIVFGQEHPERRSTFILYQVRIWLALRPICGQQFGLDNRSLPRVGARLPISHEIGWSGYPYPRFRTGDRLELLIGEAREYGWDETLETDSGTVDVGLVVIDDPSHCLHLRFEQPSVTIRNAVCQDWCTGVFRINCASFKNQLLAGEAFVFDVWVIDQRLAGRDYLSTRAKHICQLIPDLNIGIRCHRMAGSKAEAECGDKN